jgi:hypothetical protein
MQLQWRTSKAQIAILTASMLLQPWSSAAAAALSARRIAAVYASSLLGPWYPAPACTAMKYGGMAGPPAECYCCKKFCSCCVVYQAAVVRACLSSAI